MFSFFKKAELNCLEDVVRMEYQFKGTVQHVGFRFEVEMAAMNNDLTGWVKNEVDGSVIAQFQGLEENIKKTIYALYQIDRIQITSLTKRQIEVNKKEKTFKTLYY